MAKILPNFWLRNSKLNDESTKANVKQHYFTHIAHIRRAKISRNEWQKLYKKKIAGERVFQRQRLKLSTYIVIEIAIS